MRSDEGASSCLLRRHRRERCRLAVCSAGCNVANGVRINGDMVDGPFAIYEEGRRAISVSWVLLFLTPTVRHANIWGILRVRTPLAARIGSVFLVWSTAILGKHGHTSAWCIATAMQMRLYRPPRQRT